MSIPSTALTAAVTILYGMLLTLSLRSLADEVPQPDFKERPLEYVSRPFSAPTAASAWVQTSAGPRGKDLLPPPSSPLSRESVDVTPGEVSFNIPNGIGVGCQAYGDAKVGRFE